ncbi:putative ubiquitin-conjugating enzyme E2 39 [Silene latifolia]|uniref:putative ubiquitin-conjugating enzyme E2 39 n=1 Tax=Silene latifolia TaxID=37657 RepID=UPI003D784D6F
MEYGFEEITSRFLLGTKEPNFCDNTKYDDYCGIPVPDEDFPQFKIINDYYTENKFIMTCISKNFDEIYKERKTFAQNLPKLSFLRTYYKRPDLFQAAFIGPPNTPYEDGIYVFDLKLPNNYPKGLPDIIYHSHGHKLRPSIIGANGRFCNTKIFDNLDPTKSTLLQVLHCIQNTVLNGEPYPMELSPELENHLISECPLTPYLYAYQSMVDILDEKPWLFKRLIIWHFNERRDAICKKFDEVVEDHIKFGMHRGYLDLVAGEMKVDRCYAMPEEFSKEKIVKLRGNLARVFAENEANRMITYADYNFDFKALACRFKVPYFGKTIL